MQMKNDTMQDEGIRSLPSSLASNHTPNRSSIALSIALLVMLQTAPPTTLPKWGPIRFEDTFRLLVTTY